MPHHQIVDLSQLWKFICHPFEFLFLNAPIAVHVKQSDDTILWYIGAMLWYWRTCISALSSPQHFQSSLCWEQSKTPWRQFWWFSWWFFTSQSVRHTDLFKVTSKRDKKNSWKITWRISCHPDLCHRSSRCKWPGLPYPPQGNTPSAGRGGWVDLKKN